MSSFLKPWKGIIETNDFPHARALRTTFIGKLEDAFHIFFGRFNHSTEDHLGVVDYLLLGIPYFLRELDATNNSLFISFFYSFFWFVKYLVAGILTFNPASLLIIGIVHVISQHLAGGAELKEKAGNVTIYIPDYQQIVLIPPGSYTHDQLLQASNNNRQVIYLVENGSITLEVHSTLHNTHKVVVERQSIETMKVPDNILKKNFIMKRKPSISVDNFYVEEELSESTSTRFKYLSDTVSRPALHSPFVGVFE